jgi:molybdopterin converting factor subunit 1
MRVVVLYFAATRDLLGRAQEELDLPPEIGTLRALLAHLENLHPCFSGRLDTVRVAQNEAFTSLDEPLSEGDTLALIPPVAGG